MSSDGVKAAHLVAERLAGRPITAVYTSPSRRSVETVEPLARCLGLERMARNVEIKARADDLTAIRSKAVSLASDAGEVLEQRDTYLAVPKGRLKVRAFRDGSGELISYERSNEPRPRESVYTRFPCENAQALLQALSRVLPTLGTVVKRREVFLVGRTRIHLDQVDGLGTFVELEVVLSGDDAAEDGAREAHELLGALGVSRAALVAEGYLELLAKTAVYQGLPPTAPRIMKRRS